MNNNMKYGLFDFEIKNIISIFRSNKKISGAVLFGSRAMQSFHSGSDVDITLKGNNLKLKDLIDILLKIDELFLPYKFDIIIFDKIKEKKLIEHINRVGLTLYEK